MHQQRGDIMEEVLRQLGHSIDHVFPPRPGSRKRIKLGICTYSYWHFRPPKVSIETVIEKSSAIGVQGVDILHRQMDLEERAPFKLAGRELCEVEVIPVIPLPDRRVWTTMRNVRTWDDVGYHGGHG